MRNLNLLFDSEIIHCHDVFYWMLPFRFLIPFRKIYTTFHGYENYPLSLQKKLMHKVSEKLSNGNICVGHAVAKWYKTKPTFIIYGGVDIPNVQKTTVKPNSAVFFGRLDRQTGIAQYLDVYSLLKKRYPNFEFKIYGEGELRNKLPRDLYSFPFTKNTEDIISKSKYIFVSRYLSMLEALIQKKQVVAIYDDPIKKDYLLLSPFKKFVVSGGSVAEVSNLLTIFLDDPKKGDKMIKNGYEWAKNQSWEKVVGVYEKLWRR